MQWRRRNGTTGHYTGPLVDLGLGIPRRMRDHGIRRALYDLAFGYVSGFPVRDILPFALRSLFPQRTIPVAEVIMLDAVVDFDAGFVVLQCDCGETMVGRGGDRIEHADDGAHVYHPAPYGVSS
jgi:hypothetical protein